MIELERVSVVYPNGIVGLHPTSLSIAPSQVTILLGRSGAGKSTLLRSLNYLVRPTSGEVKIREIGSLKDAANLRRHRQRTAMIFQQHQLIPRQTALQNTLTGRIGFHSAWRTLLPFSNSERHLALACLDRVGLLERALDRTDRMSGGQQQRVGIARALAQEPALILADEPIASLDPVSAEAIMSQLRDICRQDDLPLVISLHHLDFARRFADRVIGLADGKVVFDGVPSELDRSALLQIYGSAAEPERSSASSDSEPENLIKLEAIG